MKTAKRIVALLLSFILLFLTSCSKPKDGEGSQNGTPESSESEITTLQLLYCSSDTLNPFNTKNSLNVQLGRLIYEPLYALGNEFDAIPVLAESITLEDKTYTIKLISAKFSDGSPVTAEDVIASYNLAKESELYSYLFYNLASASAEDGVVKFTLKEHDPYFTNLLTFPIIKKDSDKLTDSDNVELPPIGSGKFVFSRSESLQSSGNSLVKNTQYHGVCDIDVIKLVDAPDTEAVAHHVEVGATDIYFADPADGNIVRMSGHKTLVNMNNLVYIGINHKRGKLSDPALRQAISAALDRTALCKTPYYGNAEPASGFYHPDFAPTKGYQSIQLTAENKICVENLDKIGYNSLNNGGFYANDKGAIIELELLVNRENAMRVAAAEMISAQAAAAGIKITVNAVASEIYFAALSNENFDLYLGEVKISQNMDMSELILSGGSCAFGIVNPEKSDEETAIDYTDVVKGIKEGKDALSSLATALVTDMPVIPILYRSSLLFYSENVSDVDDASSYDIFLGLNSFIKKP